MSIKVFITAFLLILTNCATRHSNIEICFENIQSRINSDSILNKLVYSPIDSFGEFASIISESVSEELKSDSMCSIGINEFLLENNKNSITVNNLILFQQFQAYLKHENFNYSKALDNALKYEEKWKYSK
ncbi:MAG: hypothetical protein R3A50_07585 [Saprospiraceae bacterium]